MKLANALISFLEQMVQERVSRSSDGRVQPVFIGASGELMSVMFDLMTRDGDWVVQVAGRTSKVIVLFVDPAEGHPPGPGLSRRCNWDYVVGVRNSGQVSITLAPLSAWDARPESIANATETIGTSDPPRSSGWKLSEPWAYLAEIAAGQIGVELGKKWSGPLRSDC
jgi:hypothetical protein